VKLSAAKKDHGDQRNSRMESECAMFDHANLVVQDFQSSIRDTKTNRREHALAILPQRAGELYEWLQL
jgi:hypothetical protein